MEKKLILLEKVMPVFLAKGFNDISMDDLSAELQVSKKTFYKYFSTKDELVTACAHLFIKKNVAVVDAILSENENPIVTLTKFLEFLGTTISRISKNWMKDLFETRPDLWSHIDKFRRNKLDLTITTIYKRGESLGYFKPYPEILIIRLFTQSILSILSPEFMMKAKISADVILYDTIDVLLSGVLTKEGKSFYNRPKTRQNHEVH